MTQPTTLKSKSTVYNGMFTITLRVYEYNKLMIQIKNKTPTNLHYPEKSVFMKEVNTQNFWTFELGTQEGVNVPIWIL